MGEAIRERSGAMTNSPVADLARHFSRLLDGYSNLDYGRQMNPVDAFFAFRLLLGRNPNLSEELHRLLTDTRTFREFLNGIVQSDEFSRTNGFPPSNIVLMAERQNFPISGSGSTRVTVK